MKKRAEHILICICIYAALCLTAAMLFYDSPFAALFFAPLFFPFERYVRSLRTAHYRDELADQFIKALISVSSFLSGGVSPANAFVLACEDMEKLYGKNSAIVKDLTVLNSKIRMGVRMEDAINELAGKEKIREMDDFAVVFGVAIRKGADFPSVISSCMEIMEMRRQAEREAAIMIRSRQYEQRVMCIIPPGILLYLRLSSGSFINVLYHNTKGALIMTGCLAVYVLAIVISEKMGDIRI